VPSLPDLSAESQEKLILAKEGRVGLWSRVAGDVLDIATVLSLARAPVTCTSRGNNVRIESASL
jgi:hypothetical protein